MEKFKWLKWAKDLQTISQNGLTFAQTGYDLERYRSIAKIAAEIISEQTDFQLEKISEMFDYQIGYATPKVDVRGVVFRDEKILLVKEVVDGKWTLPGGWADPNETPALAIEREVFEESGFEVKATKLLALYDRDKQGHFPPYPFHIYKAFFLCEITGGKEKTSNETTDVKFFTQNEIPELSPARTTLKQINRFYEKLKTNDYEADFD